MLFVGIEPAELRNQYCLAVLDDEKKIQTLGTEKPQAVFSYLAGLTEVIVGIHFISKYEHLRPHTQPRRNGESHFQHAEENEIHFVAGDSIEKYSLPLHEKVISIQEGLLHLDYRYVTDQEESRHLFLAKTGDIFHQMATGNLFPLESDASRWQHQLLLAEQEIPVQDIMQYFEEVTRFRILQGNLPGEMILQHAELNAIVLAWLGWLAKHTPAKVRVIGDRFLEYDARSGELET